IGHHGQAALQVFNQPERMAELPFRIAIAELQAQLATTKHLLHILMAQQRRLVGKVLLRTWIVARKVHKAEAGMGLAKLFNHRKPRPTLPPWPIHSRAYHPDAATWKFVC